MNIRTHERLKPDLCGEPIETSDGRAVVELSTSQAMAADDSGLVHGGFTFGLADHAAMLAVNEPTVVLSSAEVKFLKPSVAGDTLTATAQIQESDGRKHSVGVTVSDGTDNVFEGRFLCIVARQHVLSSRSQS